jgi:hypothetical protein
MTTVQLATMNREYAFFLASILACEGEYEVVIVDTPDLSIPGLAVVAESLLDGLDSPDPARLVVIVSQHDIGHLLRFWQAGVRNVIFADDPPQTAYLAVLAAHMRLRAGLLQQPNYPILSAGGASLVENNLTGPFALTDSVIDEEVSRKSAGAFALDDSEKGISFRVVYVGRSDWDVNSQLHVHVGRYKRFKFVYCPSARAAFEKECQLFHDFDPHDNAVHPRRVPGSDWTCPRCKLLG